MGRKPGSGHANATAEAIEHLVAATTVGNRPDQERAMRALSDEFAGDRCGMSSGLIADLLQAAIPQLGLDAVRAVAQPRDGLGDVRVDLRDGTSRWIEVKAQTKKRSFSEITQADWVRDATDAVRFLVSTDGDLRARLPEWLVDELFVADLSYFDGWTFPDLWAADIALLDHRHRRIEAGVNVPSDLGAFMARKFVLHLAQCGVRIVSLDQLEPMAAYLTGEPVDWTYNFGNLSVFAVAVACPGLGHGQTHFTYHVGYGPGVLGRHKLHAASLSPTQQTVVVTLE